MPAKRAQRYLVTGRVQGVGFRHFVLTSGRRLGVSGWVRNLEDGRVEVLAAGDPVALEALHERLREGPPAARVDEVISAEASLDDDLEGFRVRF